MSQIEQIKIQHNQGQFEQAIKAYQQLLLTDPNNDEAHFGIAHASSRLNNLDLALKHAKEAVKLFPKSDRYQQFKGQMQLASRQFDDALISFKKSLQENPNLFQSYLAVGDIYAIKNESKQAKINYNLALKVDSNGVPAILKLAKLLLLEGDYEAATNELQQAELQFPTEPNLKLQMGIMRLEQGEDGFAEMYFNKLLADEPDHVLAKTYLAISLIQSDPEKAITIVRDLIKQQVQLPELMAALGLIYAKNKQHQEAIRYLTPICQSGLAYPSWLIALAEAYASSKQPKAAIEVLNEVLKRGENPKALLILGHMYQTNNNLPAAIKAFKRIKITAKEYNQSQLKQAECHYKAGEFNAAVKQADKLLAQNNGHKAAIKLKLNALSQLGQFKEAITLIHSIDASKQTKDFNQLMHFYAGMLFDGQQEYDQAWQHFIQIEQSIPSEVQLLNADDEKSVQNFPIQAAEPVFRFVMTDPATGHHDFLRWLLENNATPLLDRFTTHARGDIFSQNWTVDLLKKLTDAQVYLWSKKYTKHLKQVLPNNSEMVVDFMPFSLINLAIIKKVFPQAQVLILNRNFADLRLHNRVFGTYQIHYTQINKVINQMIALSPNFATVDIDAWESKDNSAIQSIEKIFGSQVGSFKIAKVKPLDRMMFPFMHWKNYQKHLNQ